MNHNIYGRNQIKRKNMLQENAEIIGAVEIADDIKQKVVAAGVRGLSIENAEKLGVFQRISNLLCTMHATITAAYRVYGGVAYLMEQLHGRKHVIAQEMNAFEKAYDRFARFWTDYYAKSKSGREIGMETERLYHKIMEWMQIPEAWNLGDEQRTEGNETAICVEFEKDHFFNLYKTQVNQQMEMVDETWGVFCYDPQIDKQTLVNTGVEKSIAMMIAKRLSVESPHNIYSVSAIRDVVEKRTEIIPYKAIINNKTVGRIIHSKK